MADPGHVGTGDSLPAAVREQFQILSRCEKQVDRGQGAVCCVHAEGFLQAEHFGIKPDAFKDVFRTDRRVAQSRDSQGFLLTHAFFSFQRD